MRNIQPSQDPGRQAVYVLTVPEYEEIRRAYDALKAAGVRPASVARLKADSKELARLEANGVDNWEGYSIGIEDEETD